MMKGTIKLWKKCKGQAKLIEIICYSSSIFFATILDLVVIFNQNRFNHKLYCKFKGDEKLVPQVQKCATVLFFKSILSLLSTKF